MPLLFYFLLGKLFALIAGGYYFKYLSPPYRLVVYVIAVAAFCESYGYYIVKHLHEYNSWVFNYYIMAEVWMMGLAAVYLVTNYKLKRMFYLLMVAASAIWIINILNYSIYVLANFSMVVCQLFMTVMYFAVLFTNGIFVNKKILNQPIFWLAFSTILYCTCGMPYWLLHNYLMVKQPGLGHKLIFINTVLDVIRYPLVAISFILLGRQKQVVLNAA